MKRIVIVLSDREHTFENLHVDYTYEILENTNVLVIYRIDLGTSDESIHCVYNSWDRFYIEKG